MHLSNPKAKYYGGLMPLRLHEKLLAKITVYF
jgi:hypothetical protein